RGPIARRPCSASSYGRRPSTRAAPCPRRRPRPAPPPRRRPRRSGPLMRADEADRRRLNDLFVELCRIESPSGREAECGARVRAELEGLGLAVEADEAGNLLARVVGSADATVMLCAHLDTVKLEALVEPVLVDD